MIGSRRRVDVALPAEVPVAELIPDVLELLGENANGTVAEWALVRVGGRALDLELSLSQQEVDEGAMVFLLDRTAAPPEPLIEDFAEQVAVAVDSQPGRWEARMVPALLVGAGGAAAAGAGLLELVAGDARTSAVLGGIGVLVVTSAALAVVGVLQRRQLGALLLFAALPLWAAAGTGIAALGHASTLATLSAALGAISLGALVAIVIAGDEAISVATGILAAALVPALVCAGAAILGGALQAAAAVVIPIELGALALTVPVTVRVAGIAAVNMQLLQARLARGRLMMASLLAGVSLTIAVACVVLAVNGQWPAWALIAVTTLAVVLRARHFRFAAEIMPLVAAALVAAVALEYPLAVWLAFTARGTGDLAALLIADAAVLVAAVLVIRRWEISPAIKPWLDRIELTAIAVSVPLALGAAGAFDAAVRFARGFG